MSGEPRALV